MTSRCVHVREKKSFFFPFDEREGRCFFFWRLESSDGLSRWPFLRISTLLPWEYDAKNGFWFQSFSVEFEFSQQISFCRVDFCAGHCCSHLGGMSMAVPAMV